MTTLTPDVDALALDVYGTLVDTGGQVDRLRSVVGDRAPAFSDAWRQVQLEYTFRRAVMRDWVDFGVCTAQALDAVAQRFEVALTDDERQGLLDGYRRLPAYDDAREALQRLRDSGVRAVAFTNGVEASARDLLDHAGLLPLLDDVVTVEPVQSFKPDPAVYAHLLATLDLRAERVALVSGNSFDIIGAKHVGLAAVWVRRSPAAALDPWGVSPDRTVSALTELLD
ncbi:haloacid dehalogenase type II [Nocardioides aestuarii]|uniref:Haloacid dehalogenase type II n=1 Tax=Nocardioides aestuarii TaxID=252231 RepID=A0ABW4TLD2_9ACTN